MNATKKGLSPLFLLRTESTSLPLLSVGSSLSKQSFFSSSSSSGKPTQMQKDSDKRLKTGILMLNMGGPSTLQEVQPFLTRLFTDRDIMQLPFQDRLGPWIAKRRTPSITKKYADIGGGSPILDWTRKQGQLLVDILDRKSAITSPHKYYVAFRYAKPLLTEALEELVSDDVKRVVIFSQYPHYSCSTSGSSLNQLAQHLTSLPSDHPLNSIKWSLIDRWPLNRGLIKCVADLIQKELPKLPQGLDPTKVVLLFSAHSLPMKVVNKGDTYPQEVAATVLAVMKELSFSFPYRLVWQSKVGPLPWLSPATDAVIRSYSKGRHGIKNFVVIPIAFVNEHIETLHELDIEYGKELCHELQLDNILRVPAPNTHPYFIEGLFEEVSQHLSTNAISSPQIRLTCPHCSNQSCFITRKWIATLHQATH